MRPNSKKEIRVGKMSKRVMGVSLIEFSLILEGDELAVINNEATKLLGRI